MYLKIKIHQTSFHCALQNFKIDVDIAIEKTHSLGKLVFEFKELTLKLLIKNFRFTFNKLIT
jgi:hypothetical protein